MAAQATPSRFVAFITIFFFLGLILVVSYLAFYLTTANSSNQAAPTPTPTPEPGLYNIDEQLDMLN